MKTLLNILLFLCTYYCIGQTAVSSYEENANFEYQNNSDSQILRVSQGLKKGIKGSVYLKNWENATIINHREKRKTSRNARYNTLTNEIEILQNKKIVALKPLDSLEVILNKKRFVPIKLSENSKTIFLEILVNGDRVKIYNQYEVKIQRAPNDAKLLNLEEDDKIKIVENLYYVRANDKTIYPFPKNKKSFNKIIDDATIAYSKANKLSFKKSEDVKRIFEFYNLNRP